MLMSIEDLTSQISRIQSLDLETINTVRSEIERADISWVEDYCDFQSGGWWTTSLLNHSRDPADTQIQDGVGAATSLLETLPCTRKLIEGLGLPVMWARLARLCGHSFLWEHVDYTELRPLARHRLHVPLVTNSSSRLVIAGKSINLAAGHLWRLVPSHPHGVCNYFGPDRIHIVIDCYEDGHLKKLLDAADLAGEELTHLPPANDAVLKRARLEAANLLGLGFQKAAERHLLLLFFRYSVPAGLSYDLISDLYMAQGLKDKAEAWHRKKGVMLGRV